MISLLLEFALFILVMFFVLPVLLIFVMVIRELLHERRKQAEGRQRWQRGAGELMG